MVNGNHRWGLASPRVDGRRTWPRASALRKASVLDWNHSQRASFPDRVTAKWRKYAKSCGLASKVPSGLAGQLGPNVWLGERPQTALRVTCYRRHTLLFTMMCSDKGSFWPRFSSVSGYYLPQKGRSVQDSSNTPCSSKGSRNFKAIYRLW